MGICSTFQVDDFPKRLTFMLNQFQQDCKNSLDLRLLHSRQPKIQWEIAPVQPGSMAKMFGTATESGLLGKIRTMRVWIYSDECEVIHQGGHESFERVDFETAQEQVNAFTNRVVSLLSHDA